MSFFANYKAANTKLAEQRKQQLKDFGTWRAFVYGFFIFSTFGFFGMVITFLTGSLLYGIPQYMAFALLATLATYLSFHPSVKARTKGNVSDASSARTIVIVGITYILIQMITSYFNMYLLEKDLRFSSFEIVLAIVLRHDVAGFVRTLCPSFEDTAKTKNTIVRLGILALSLTALVPLFTGWLAGHIATKLTPALQTDFLPILGFAIPAVIMGFIVKEVFANKGAVPTTPKLLHLTIALVATLGIANGLTTGNASALEGDTMTSPRTLQVILYAMLASEVLAILTLWFLLVFLPRHYGKTLSKGPIKAKKA